VEAKMRTDNSSIHKRLNRISGQLRAIDKMIDGDIPCDEILIQINAAKSALHRVGKALMEDHIELRIRECSEHGDVDDALADLGKAFEQFSRI
jgi:DNA-binding FrmR family transcriptional regulator